MSKRIDKDGFLTRMLRSDDAKAITILYQEYYRDVVQAAFNIVKDKEVAKDIAQELFIAIWEKRHVLDFDKPMKFYLMRSVYNQSLSYLRKSSKAQHLRISNINKSSFENTSYRIDQEMEFRELNALIYQNIERLPSTCKKVYKLSRNDGLTNAQIAERLGFSVKAVEKHITKAVKAIRSALKDHLKLLLVLILG